MTTQRTPSICQGNRTPLDSLTVYPIGGFSFPVKPLKILLLLALGILPAGAAPDSPLESTLPSLEGILTTDRTSFAIKSASTQAVQWLSLGDVIDGYHLDSYDRGKETLMLSKDGSHYSAKLRDPKIKPLTVLSREEALHSINDLIAGLLERTRNLATYQPLPAEEEFTGSSKAIVEYARTRAKTDGNPIYVVKHPGDGLPMIIRGQADPFAAISSALTQNLTNDDKTELTAKFHHAAFESAYNVTLARQAPPMGQKR